MINEEKIKKNAEKFHNSAVKYGVMNDELLSLLGSDFISAPCSTSTHLYNAYDGGLIAHILQTTKQAVNINNSLPEDKQVNQNSLIRVALLHQIGKSRMFIEQDSQWHKDNRGEMYKFNEDLLSMKTGERSVYYALKSGIELTEDEVFAIYNQDIDFGHRKLTSLGEKLAAILKIANLTSIMIAK